MNTLIDPTRILEYIRDLLPWAHGHHIKCIATFVVAIIEKQTGNQAELARPSATRKQRSNDCLGSFITTDSSHGAWLAGRP
jgi:hypothetical protein